MPYKWNSCFLVCASTQPFRFHDKFRISMFFAFSREWLFLFIFVIYERGMRAYATLACVCQTRSFLQPSKISRRFAIKQSSLKFLLYFQYKYIYARSGREKFFLNFLRNWKDGEATERGMLCKVLFAHI